MDSGFRANKSMCGFVCAIWQKRVIGAFRAGRMVLLFGWICLFVVHAQTPISPGEFDGMFGMFYRWSPSQPSVKMDKATSRASFDVTGPPFTGRIEVDFPQTIGGGTAAEEIVLKGPERQAVRVIGTLSEPATVEIALGPITNGNVVVPDPALPLQCPLRQTPRSPVGPLNVTHECNWSWMDRRISGTSNFFEGFWQVSVRIRGTQLGDISLTVDLRYAFHREGLGNKVELTRTQPESGSALSPGRQTFSSFLRYTTLKAATVVMRIVDKPVGGSVLASSPAVAVERGETSQFLTIRDFEVTQATQELYLVGYLIDRATQQVIAEAVPIGYSNLRSVPPNPFPPRAPTDTRFIATSGRGLKTACLAKGEGPLEIDFDISRVVGRVDGAGKLQDWTDLYQKRMVSEYALLRIASFGRRLRGGSARRDPLRLNGESFFAMQPTEDVIRGDHNTWVVTPVFVPIQFLLFPGRVTGQPAVPRKNTLTIRIDDGGNDAEAWCTAVDWVELSFNAMAPVILIHGNGQGDDGKGGEFWDGRVLDTATQPRLQMSTSIAQAFRAEYVPYDNTISMFTDTIAEHGEQLKTLIPDRAAEFGSKHVHLVAHSKGGLDSRQFLAETIPRNFGVLSLITLSTPHQGSVGPDYQMDAAVSLLTESDDAIRGFIGYMAAPNKGTPNLRVAYAREFNQKNVPLLPRELTVDGETAPVAYRSFSADMNLDGSTNFFTGNPTISYDETYGLPGQNSKPSALWAEVMQTAYRITGYVAETYTEVIEFPVDRLDPRVKVKVIREILNSEFKKNDIAVTQEASKVGPFVEVEHLKANHSSIAMYETGRKVADVLREVQPVRGPEIPK